VFEHVLLLPPKVVLRRPYNRRARLSSARIGTEPNLKSTRMLPQKGFLTTAPHRNWHKVYGWPWGLLLYRPAPLPDCAAAGRRKLATRKKFVHYCWSDERQANDEALLKYRFDDIFRPTDSTSERSGLILDRRTTGPRLQSLFRRVAINLWC